MSRIFPPTIAPLAASAAEDEDLDHGSRASYARSDRREHGRTGRALGGDDFLARLEKRPIRVLRRQNRAESPNYSNDQIKDCVRGIPTGKGG